MTIELQVRLLQAIVRCLRPMARMLLRAGVSYSQFEDVAKLAFVQEALGGRDARGRTTNVSRVAVRTGISRKEVSRLRDSIERAGAGRLTNPAHKFHSNQAARVLQFWHSDGEYLQPNGAPRELPFDSGLVSFSGLVKRVGGDIPAGAVRAELINAGAILELSDGCLRAVKRYFIPADIGEDLYIGFGQIVAPLLEALAHNTSAPKADAYVQRVAYSEGLSPEMRVQLRAYSSSLAANLVHDVDDWIGEKELPESQAENIRERVGVGVFYYEVPADPEE